MIGLKVYSIVDIRDKSKDICFLHNPYMLLPLFPLYLYAPNNPIPDFAWKKNSVKFLINLKNITTSMATH